jgi:hypothetical protein
MIPGVLRFSTGIEVNFKTFYFNSLKINQEIVLISTKGEAVALAIA